MFSVAKPRIEYDQTLRESPNVFRDKFSSLSDKEWKAVWLSTENGTNISGVEFPTIPDQQLQLSIHGSSSWQISIGEAFSFYSFIKSKVDLLAVESPRFLDFGCGWGRMTRPFLRDFDLDKMFGFEPNLLLATVARSLNPYVSVLSGGFTPDGSIPKNWFDMVIGWSIFSHLSDTSLRQWLGEVSQVLRPGGAAVFTTWGLRFLRRLQRDQQLLKEGQELHWYARKCIEGAGDLPERVAAYERGEFVWFAFTGSKTYGEAFFGERALRQIIAEEGLPLTVVDFDDSSLSQDVFLLRRASN
jgi:SAM-dependent methyltransferase